MNMETLRKQLLTICQNNTDDRKVEIIKELNNNGISFNTFGDNAIVCPSNSNEVIVLCAHYDVYPNSFGYNDNGMSILTILNLIKSLPDNVEVVFSNYEERGGLGSEYYINNCKKKIIKCINLDVCGIGDYLYCDNYGNNFSMQDCNFGRMPFCDGNVFAIYKIPVITFSTSYKNLKFGDGIMEIFKTIHCNEKDNDINIINFELVDLVSDAVIKSIDTAF